MLCFNLNFKQSGELESHDITCAANSSGIAAGSLGCGAGSLHPYKLLGQTADEPMVSSLSPVSGSGLSNWEQLDSANSLDSGTGCFSPDPSEDIINSQALTPTASNDKNLSLLVKDSNLVCVGEDLRGGFMDGSPTELLVCKKKRGGGRLLPWSVRGTLTQELWSSCE